MPLGLSEMLTSTRIQNRLDTYSREVFSACVCVCVFVGASIADKTRRLCSSTKGFDALFFAAVVTNQRSMCSNFLI